jgi:hypothetical protein
MKQLFGIAIVLLLTFTSCQRKVSKGKQFDARTQQVLDQLIEAHGGEAYTSANYTFEFRGKTYSFVESKNVSSYELNYEKDGQSIKETLVNGNFNRWINGEQLELSADEKSRLSGGINSVIYFATLPYRLLDPAVNAQVLKEVEIEGKPYIEMRVTFDQEGGGKDHDDEYMYWINKESNQLDFLAYNYSVNKGGVRFRSAFNKRNVGGIIFQDYINYKAEVGTALEDLPQLWEQGQLKELSKILTENVINNSK